MKFALAANSYGPIDPRAARSLRQALILAERRGFHMTADLSQFHRHLIMGRNAVHELVVKDKNADYEGVLWVDSDIIMPHDAIARLLGHVNEKGVEFVSGVYFKRGGDFEPLVGEFYEQETPRGMEWWSRFRRAFGPGNGLVELPRGTCGFGFVYTSLRVLELHPSVGSKHVHDPGPFTKLPFIGEPGDDFSFCYRTTVEKGESLWVDTDLLLGHLTEDTPVGFEDFVASAMSGGRIL